MDTGTPNPRKEIDAFVRRIVTESDISLETWLEGLEHYRLYIVQEIFPRITLHPLEQEEWMRCEKPRRIGNPQLYQEQGMYFLDEGCGDQVLWGLTRRGIWINGHILSGQDQRIIKVFAEECTGHDLLQIRLCNLTFSTITARLRQRIKQEVIDRYRRYQDFDRSANAVEFFADIVGIKLGQKA